MERASACEEMLLKILWQSGKPELSTKEVIDGYKKCFGKEYARTTVVTFAVRLIEKKLISSTRIGKQAYLKALISKEEYRMEVLKQDLDFWFDGNKEEMQAAVLNV